MWGEEMGYGERPEKESKERTGKAAGRQVPRIPQSSELGALRRQPSPPSLGAVKESEAAGAKSLRAWGREESCD